LFLQIACRRRARGLVDADVVFRAQAAFEAVDALAEHLGDDNMSYSDSFYASGQACNVLFRGQAAGVVRERFSRNLHCKKIFHDM
jgi:hypothetical protein